MTVCTIRRFPEMNPGDSSLNSAAPLGFAGLCAELRFNVNLSGSNFIDLVYFLWSCCFSWQMFPDPLL